MNEPLTCQALPGYLERNFPDYLPMIWAVRALNHTAAVTADMLTSDVFVDHIFADGVKSGDRALLAKCFATVERALSGPDKLLHKIFMDYVSPVVLSTDRWALLTQELAGPLLRVSLDASAGIFWRHQAGGFGSAEALDPPPSVMVSGYLYQEEILLHSRRHISGGNAVATTEPFARVPARSSAYSLGVTVAKMLESLSRPADETPQHDVDRFMSFAGCADWRVFYSESLSVEIESVIGSHAVSIWPIHKADLGGPHLNRWPDQPLLVTDWRDAPDLGAAVLTAFGTATTTGRSKPG